MDLFRYLEQPVGILKGIGEQNSSRLHAYFGKQRKISNYHAKMSDLLLHLPYEYIDRRTITPLAFAREAVQTIQVRVLKHLPFARQSKRLSPYRIQCEDDTGSLLLIFFKSDTRYLHQHLPEGKEVIISGTLQRYDGMWQMAHPDIITTPEKASEVCRLEGLYPATEGVSARMFARWCTLACEKLPESDEWMRDSTLRHYRWPSHSMALRYLHTPDTPEQTVLARARLAYDEALAHQLALRLLRMEERRQAGVMLSLWEHPAMLNALRSLPFTLTDGQKGVLSEIDADIRSGERMLRLLQGDVGAGKTIVAALTMLAAVTAGYQAVLMAPTELLARQHLNAIDALIGLQATPVIFLAGSLTSRQREEAREKLRSTPAAMIIGTHALFQEGVEFSNLAMVVIDEQHRFGVAQRLALSDKGLVNEEKAPHILLMTATPIPRSLAMACYGDLDVSLLKQKPADRLPIETLAMGTGKLEALCAGLSRALHQGEKIYWVCPLVEEMSGMVTNPLLASLQAAESRYQSLKILFPGKVGMVHGRMNMTERESVMQAFMRGDIQILVATTVVEVGVDVPDATVMVIENAERFGLAQLHQLRGRVGRGKKQSRCVLLYQERCSQAAKERLKIMRETNNGFIIAEADLKQRGSGELLGTRQTGLPEYRFLSLDKDGDTLAAAKQEAAMALEEDPDLASKRGQLLRRLLSLFQLEDAVRYLRSG